MRVFGCAIVVFGVLAGAISSPVLAARCDFPDYGFFIQHDTEIPGNSRGIIWAGHLRAVGGIEELPEASCFTLDRAEGTAWIPVRFELNSVRNRYRDPLAVAGLVLVTPVEGFERGKRYRATCRRRGDRDLLAVGGETRVDRQEISFLVSVDTLARMSDPEKLPLQLDVGEAEHGVLCVATGSDSTLCADAVYVDIGLPAMPDLDRWSESLLYTTTVTSGGYRDYRAWHPRSNVCQMQPPGRSWMGPGRDRLYRICDKDNSNRLDIRANLDEGKYRVRLEVWLPGTRIGTTAFGGVQIGCGE